MGVTERRAFIGCRISGARVLRRPIELTPSGVSSSAHPTESPGAEIEPETTGTGTPTKNISKGLSCDTQHIPGIPGRLKPLHNPMAHRDTPAPKIRQSNYVENLRVCPTSRFTDAPPAKLSRQGDSNATFKSCHRIWLVRLCLRQRSQPQQLVRLFPSHPVGRGLDKTLRSRTGKRGDQGSSSGS